MSNQRDRIFNAHKCHWRLVRHGDGSGSIIEICGNRERPYKRFDSYEEAREFYENENRPPTQAELLKFLKSLDNSPQ